MLNTMSLPAFSPPPLVLKVGRLDLVPEQPDRGNRDVLSMEDVRQDAQYQRLTVHQYQKIAEHNRRMQVQRALLLIVIMGLVGLLLGQHFRPAQKTGPAETSSTKAAVAAAPQAALPAPAETGNAALQSPVIQAAASQSAPPTEQELAEKWKAIGALAEMVQKVRDSNTQVVAPQAPSNPSVLTVVPKMSKSAPIAKEVSKTLSVAAQAKQAEPATPPAAQNQAALPTVKIIDFFGQNKAVMLSISGGEERTFRVGDVLPGGETISSIDSQAGQMQTSKRTINR